MYYLTTGTIHINQLCVNTIAIDYRMGYDEFISCPTLWKKAKSTANCLYILTNKNTQYRSKGSGKNWFLLLWGLSLNVVFAKRCEKKVAFLPKVNFRVFFKGGGPWRASSWAAFFPRFPLVAPVPREREMDHRSQLMLTSESTSWV